MKKIYFLLYCLIIITALNSCKIKNQSIFNEQANENNITMIQIALDFNENPNGKNEAKFITSKKEISEFIKAFQNTKIGDEVEIRYGNSSVFRFYSADAIIYELFFYNTDEKVYLDKKKNYQCSFLNEDPWELYGRSNAELIYIDNNFINIK
ncbi:MAG: hypothetical protein ACYCYI_01750 [Saccharofermentanales bacterium]